MWDYCEEVFWYLSYYITLGHEIFGQLPWQICWQDEKVEVVQKGMWLVGYVGGSSVFFRLR